MKDVVQVLDQLRTFLKIEKVQLGIGGSYGGQQLLEWMVLCPDLFQTACVIGATHRQSPWAVALNESQRLALAADPTFGTEAPGAGAAGLAAARSIAVLSYRTHAAYVRKQSESCDAVADDFRASSYQRHIGQQFVKRFNAYSYWCLSKIMDSHNVGRGRQSGDMALRCIRARTLFLGLDGDILFPPESVRETSSHVPHAIYAEITCDYGHDSILTQAREIGRHVLELRTFDGIF